MRRPTLKHRLEYAGFRLVSAVVGWIPEPLALALGEGLGWVAGTVIRVRRRDVDRNLARAFPELPRGERARMARACFRHIGREGLAIFLLGREDAVRIRRRTEVVGIEVLQRALEEGRGALVVTGHLGNWEVAGAALAARGIPLDVVVQVQRNPLFNRDLVETRLRLGMRLIPRKDAVRSGLRSLREGRALALAADQNVREGGIFVDFFGSPASTARGPAVFALRAGSPVVFLAAERLPGWRGRYRVTLEQVPVERSSDPDEEARRLTAAHTALLEHHVRRIPVQYFWPHRRWKTRPPEPSREGDV